MHAIPPSEAAARLNAGNATIIDIRSADEFARGHIPGALNIAADGIDDDTAKKLLALNPIFCCTSGRRTEMLISRLSDNTNTVCIDGGLNGWKAAGLATNDNSAYPRMLDIQRQVQITVGVLVVLAVVLTFTVSTWFAAMAGAIGLGLLSAGLTGTCALAAVIMRMPWNRPRKKSA